MARTQRRRGEKLDPYLVHEALDRTNMLSEVICSQLLEHQGVKAIPRAAKLIERAADMLDRAYQVIGASAVYETSLTPLKFERAKRSKP